MADRQVVRFLAAPYAQKGLRVAGQQSLKNLYLHPTPGYSDGRGAYVTPMHINDAAIYGVMRTPGTDLGVTIAGSQVRACLSYLGNGYVVVDNQIWKVTSTLVASQLTITLAGSTGVATMAAVGNEIVVCCNSKIYRIAVLTDVVTDITASLTAIDALNIPIWVMSQNNRFIYMTSNANYVYISNLLAAATITALDAYSPNTLPGTLTSGAVTSWYQYYFRDNSVEVYADTGAEIGPFSRVTGGAVRVGSAAQQSALAILDKVYYLGRTESGILGIIELTGSVYKVVSTPDFVQTVNDYYRVTDAIAWTDTHNGHVFYNLTFPTKEFTAEYSTNIGVTWSYDVTTGLLFQRTSFEVSTSRESRHIANCSMYLGGFQLVGAWNSGVLYKLDTDFLDDDGQLIYRQLVTGTLTDRDSFFSMYNLEIDVERGIGLVSGQGSDPQITIEISKDRGYTYGNPIVRSAPAVGIYNQRVRISSIGGARSMTLRLSMTDPVAWAFNGITAEIEGSIN